MSMPQRKPEGDGSLRLRLAAVAVMVAGFVALVFALSTDMSFVGSAKVGDKPSRSGTLEVPLPDAIDPVRGAEGGSEDAKDTKAAILAELDAMRGTLSLGELWHSLKTAREAAEQAGTAEAQLRAIVRDLEEKFARSEHSLKHASEQAEITARSWAQTISELESARASEKQARAAAETSGAAEAQLRDSVRDLEQQLARSEQSLAHANEQAALAAQRLAAMSTELDSARASGKQSREATDRIGAAEARLHDRVRDLEGKLAVSEASVARAREQAEQSAKLLLHTKSELEAARTGEAQALARATQHREALARTQLELGTASAKLKHASELADGHAKALQQAKNELAMAADAARNAAVQRDQDREALAQTKAQLAGALEREARAAAESKQRGETLADLASQLEAVRRSEAREKKKEAERLVAAAAELRARLESSHEKGAQAAADSERQRQSLARLSAELETARDAERRAAEKIEKQNEALAQMSARLQAGLERAARAADEIERLSKAVSQLDAELNAARERAKQAPQDRLELRMPPEIVPGNRIQDAQCPPVVRLREPSQIQFSRGEFQPSKDFEARLGAVVIPRLLELIERYGADTIEVVGHTDPMPLLNRDSNLDQLLTRFLSYPADRLSLRAADNAGLGMARAAAVARVLARDGRLRKATVVPLSAAQLVNPDGTLADGGSVSEPAARRRIEVRLRRSESWIDLQ